MRTLIAAVAASSMILSGCSAITDNVSIDVDGIIASTCEALADQLSHQVETQLSELTDQSQVDLPDFDIQGAIDRAEELGCSPDDMRALITENLETIDATSEKAREVLSELQEQTQGS